jgi:hypothetical protein
MSMAHASVGTYGQYPSFALSLGPIVTAAVQESVTLLTKAYIGKVVAELVRKELQVAAWYGNMRGREKHRG